jgi:tetratricopeptide (TPR) repeat protein
MRDAIPRGPFDQGLFLAHFNKGKDLYDGRRYPEAESELEEAYLLRPRDPRVLNLLGLIYFKQEKLGKAEEVYRKLVAESPEAHTLHYNLGLICFKLNRMEDAESAFLKALELARDNAKINFYLGSIYERLHRYKDAIYQYRQAGANLMVRRVEDKMASGGPPSFGAPPSSPATRPRTKAKDDTAEFPKAEVHEEIRRMASDEALARADQALAFAGKTVQPVSESILAASPATRELPSDTARYRMREDTLPPGTKRHPEIRPYKGDTDPALPAPDAGAKTARRSPEIFRFLENNLMEIDFSGKVFIKQGTIYSYSGNLTFWVKDKRPGGQPPLVILTGTGRVILTDHDREITFMQVHDETVYVEPGHLLACEEGLTPRYVPLGEGGLEILALEGRGMVALSVASKPLPLTVTPGLPVSVPAASVITWSGDLVPRLVDDPQIHAVMLHSGPHAGSLLRLEGTGRILVEQAVP